MPNKPRLRVPRGASMAKGGMRPVSTSETASPTHWPSSQGRNSWQKERIFGLPTRNWYKEAGHPTTVSYASGISKPRPPALPGRGTPRKDAKDGPTACSPESENSAQFALDVFVCLAERAGLSPLLCSSLVLVVRRL